MGNAVPNSTAQLPDVLTVSVVSHGHGAWLPGLLDQLVLTHNLPEPLLPAPPEGWPFRVTQVQNSTPVDSARTTTGRLHWPTRGSSVC